MNKNQNLRLTAKTFHGLENTLANELHNINAQNIEIKKRAVQFSGNLKTIYQANYSCRTALSVLMEIAFFKAHNEDYLYRKAKQVNWEDYLTPQQTFSITKTVNSKYFKHSQFVALRLKDAIADYFKEKFGTRPNVDKDKPDIVVDLHISHTNVNISLDTSGEPLFKRNYRKATGIAPLNEVLAAGLLLNIPDVFDKKLFDPFCGSGTIISEYTLMALNIPAGYFRNEYAFMNYPNFSEELFKEVKSLANKKIKSEIPHMPVAADIDARMIDVAKSNFENAGIAEYIDIKQADFFKASAPDGVEVMLFNPPYNKRLSTNNIQNFYKKIGDALKQNYPDTKAYIFTGFPEAVKIIGLRTNSRRQFYNGKIESRLLEYRLFKGNLKSHKNRV